PIPPNTNAGRDPGIIRGRNPHDPVRIFFLQLLQRLAAPNRLVASLSVLRHRRDGLRRLHLPRRLRSSSLSRDLDRLRMFKRQQPGTNLVDLLRRRLTPGNLLERCLDLHVMAVGLDAISRERLQNAPPRGVPPEIGGVNVPAVCCLLDLSKILPVERPNKYCFARRLPKEPPRPPFNPPRATGNKNPGP